MAIGNVAGDVVTTGANNISIGINTDPSADDGNGIQSQAQARR